MGDFVEVVVMFWVIVVDVDLLNCKFMCQDFVMLCVGGWNIVFGFFNVGFCDCVQVVWLIVFEGILLCVGNLGVQIVECEGCL